MNKTTYFFLIFLFAFVTNIQKASACYASFSYKNAAAGDTVWFKAFDMYALQYWDFGDNTSPTTPNTSHDTITYHVYTQPGTYIVHHFTNIGAEWAYSTKVITIGTDTFGALFKATSQGSGYFSIENISLGDNLTYTWNFGGGVNDTATGDITSHNFVTPGIYTITLTISDGVQSDTYTQTVNTGSVAAWTNDNYMSLPCIGDSAMFYYTNTPGNFTVLNWDFGDPSSGASNTISGNGQPKHIFSTPGFYTITLIASNGAVNDTFKNVFPVIDCRVYPGDADRNGFVEAEDIFVIGLQYGVTGTTRPNANITFTPQPSPDWAGLGMYLDAMVNQKHADCNGDGIINDLDVNIIDANFASSNKNWNTLSFMNADANDPTVSLGTPSGLLNGGAWVEIPILLGDATIQAPNMYGFSTVITFDPTLIKPNSISVLYDNSWLGAQDSLLHIEKVIGNQIHIGFTRFNHQNVLTGMGQIARLRFQIENGANGTLTLTPTSDTKLLSHWAGFGGSGGIEKLTDAHLVNGSYEVSSVGIEQALYNSVQLYPNPANDIINVVSSETIHSVELFDLTGKSILFTEKTDKIDISSLANGIYALEVTTAKGKVVKKIVVE